MGSCMQKVSGNHRKKLSWVMKFMKMKWCISIQACSEEGRQSTRGQGRDEIWSPSKARQEHKSTSRASPEGATDPEPLFCLVFALQPQHNDVSVRWDDLQLVLFLPHLLFLVNNRAAQQIHVELRAVVFGALVALRKEDGRAGKRLRKSLPPCLLV